MAPDSALALRDPAQQDSEDTASPPNDDFVETIFGRLNLPNTGSARNPPDASRLEIDIRHGCCRDDASLCGVRHKHRRGWCDRSRLTRPPHQDRLKQNSGCHRAYQRKSHHPAHARQPRITRRPHASKRYRVGHCTEITARVRLDCNNPVFPARQASM
jgi:hypothetical protein